MYSLMLNVFRVVIVIKGMARLNCYASIFCLYFRTSAYSDTFWYGFIMVEHFGACDFNKKVVIGMFLIMFQKWNFCLEIWTLHCLLSSSLKVCMKPIWERGRKNKTKVTWVSVCEYISNIAFTITLSFLCDLYFSVEIECFVQKIF